MKPSPKIYIALLTFTLCKAAWSQIDTVGSDLESGFPETIITDRPDQTEAPQLTPPGWFQIEAGIQSEFDYDKPSKVRSQGTLFNTTLWKYGLTRQFEFRLITEYAKDKFTFQNEGGADTSITEKGFNPISIGSKIFIHEGDGWLVPSVSLITHLTLPYIGAKGYRPHYVIPRFRFLFAHSLNDRFTFSYNLGAEWEDGASNATGIYTASLGISLADRLSMFVEAYGFLRENTAADNRLDGGFTFLINNDIQLDCSGGVGISEISPDYFISGGLSIRLNAFGKKTGHF